LKNAFAFLAQLTRSLNWTLHCSGRPQELFIDPLAIQWPSFDPVTIYRPLGWSNWPLGVDIDHFENHWLRQTGDFYSTLMSIFVFSDKFNFSRVQTFCRWACERYKHLRKCK